MARTATRKGSLLFLDGIDKSLPNEYISDQSVTNSENFVIRKGVLVKRSGSTELGSTQSEEILGGRELVREGTRYNVRIGLDEIRNYNTGTTTWDDVTGTDLTGTTDDNIDTAVPMLSSKRILCLTNGIDNIRKWTGTGNTADLGGTPPVAKFIQEYKSYLFTANVAGGTDVAQRVQWSSDADPENWSTGNSGSKDLDEDGGDITGLNIFGNYICVHKEASIYLGYLVNTSAIVRFDRKPTGRGTIANNTITNLPSEAGGQAFLASDGIAVFNGVSAQLIDDKVNDEIRTGLNPEYQHKAWSVLVKEKDEVWFGIPIGSETTGDTVYKFNYKRGTVLKDTRSNATAAWRALASSSLTWDDLTGTWDENPNNWNDGSLITEFPQVNISDNTGKTVIVDDTVNDDDGSAVVAFIDTKDFEADIKGQLANWLEVELWAKGNTVECFYSIDGGTTWTEFDQSSLTLDNDYPSDDDPKILYLDVVSSKLRLRFRNQASGETVSVKQFTVGYAPRELRQ